MPNIFKVDSGCPENIFLIKATTYLSIFAKLVGITSYHYISSLKT